VDGGRNWSPGRCGSGSGRIRASCAGITTSSRTGRCAGSAGTGCRRPRRRARSRARSRRKFCRSSCTWAATTMRRARSCSRRRTSPASSMSVAVAFPLMALRFDFMWALVQRNRLSLWFTFWLRMSMTKSG
jgi:hypothetical protein